MVNNVWRCGCRFLSSQGTDVNNKVRIPAGKNYKGDNNALRNNKLA